jgi:hypothetical protein
MKISNLLKTYTSSFYTPYPYIIRYVNNSSNYNDQRFVVIKNLNFPSNTKELIEGIRFDVVNGSLSNQTPITQPIVVKILNKNNLSIYGNLVLNFYEIEENTRNLILKNQEVIYSVTSSEQMVSKTITGKNIFISLESPTGVVLYTTQDLGKGLIPIRQDLFIKIISEASEIYLPVFYSEESNEVFALNNYRTINQKYIHSLTPRIFENANLCDTQASNIIGDFSAEEIKDYLFSTGYYVTDRQRNYVRGTTLSLLEFLHDFYNNTNLDKFFLPDLSRFERYEDFYYYSYYEDLISLNPQPNEHAIDIRNEVLSLFLASFILDSLTFNSIDRFNRKLNFFLNNFSLLPEKYITSNGTQAGGTKLFTNLLYLQILRNTGRLDYQNIKELIKTNFLDNDELEINVPTGDMDYISTNQSGVEAYIIKILLNKHFNINEYSNILPRLDEIIASKSVLIGAINKITDPTSENYNPYFQINFDSPKVFYLHGDYVPFALNALLFKLAGFNFPSELFSNNGLISSNVYRPSKMLFILPEFFSSMVYLATKHFYFSDIQFSRPEEETQIAFVDAKAYGSVLDVKIMLNVPKKVYGFLLDRNTNYVYKIEFSPVRSLDHELIFHVAGLDLSNIKLAFILS